MSQILNLLQFYLLGHLTCFTCGKSKTNEDCNKQAIDEPCRFDTNSTNKSNNKPIQPKNAACMTIHKFNKLTFKTISVEKKCSVKCDSNIVGCETSPVLNQNNIDEHIRVRFFKKFSSQFIIFKF